MQKVINKYCPRSGKRVSEDALTQYQGYTVGFCNTGCRDDFAANMQSLPKDCRYFDVLITESESSKR